jgi:hypothetical protein
MTGEVAVLDLSPHCCCDSLRVSTTLPLQSMLKLICIYENTGIYEEGDCCLIGATEDAECIATADSEYQFERSRMEQDDRFGEVVHCCYVRFAK